MRTALKLRKENAVKDFYLLNNQQIKIHYIFFKDVIYLEIITISDDALVAFIP